MALVQCRSCLSTEATEYLEMTSSMMDKYSVLDCFVQCTQLEPGPKELPVTMCIACSHVLQIVFDFRQVARASDARLRENLVRNRLEEEDAFALESETIEEHLEELDEEQEQYEVQESMMEELLEDDDIQMGNVELLQVEVVDGQMTQDSVTDDTEYVPPVKNIVVEPLSTGREAGIKKQHSSTANLYVEDELDDEYIIEYDKKLMTTAFAGTRAGAMWRCVECHRVLRGDVSYEGHMNMHRNVRPYRCKQCPCSFRCKFALDRHAMRRHEPTQCEKGSKALLGGNNLETHSVHSADVIPTAPPKHCKKCTKTFDTSDDLATHMRLIHFVSRKRPAVVTSEASKKYVAFKCDFCKHIASSESELFEHRSSHVKKRPNECKHCGKIFATALNLGIHIRSMHPQQRTQRTSITTTTTTTALSTADHVVQCGVCKKNLLRRNLEKHMTLHDKESIEPLKYLCSYCQRECRNQKSLNQHEKLHQGESPDVVYICADCDRQYATEHLLMQHRKLAHKKRDHICEICGNAFKLKNQLMNHMKLHLEKNIQCPHCDKRYARKFDLNVHMRTHTGELPFECHLCNKRFAIKVRLTYHLQKHYGVKHPCKECGVEFNSRQKLKAHSYKHTGMPYRCELCNDHGFANRDVFKRHLQRVHAMTMTDKALVQMFQRNTGKTIRIQTVDEMRSTEVEIPKDAAANKALNVPMKVETSSTALD